MTLVDVQEFTATNKDAYLLVNQTFQGQVLSKSTVQNVKMYMPLNLDTKIVSLILFLLFTLLYKYINCDSATTIYGGILYLISKSNVTLTCY